MLEQYVNDWGKTVLILSELENSSLLCKFNEVKLNEVHNNNAEFLGNQEKIMFPKKI